jgi:peptide/nickel transport system permease protein
MGIWLGSLSAIKRNTIFDHSTRIMAVIGWSLPTFLFALILLMVFYGYIGSYLSQFDTITILGFNLDPELIKFEPGILSETIKKGLRDDSSFIRYTGMYTIDGLLNGRLEIFWDALRHLVLPIMTQVIVIIAVIIRVMRSSMIEEISRDYIITARAKGADRHTIFMKHAKKNALLPVITVSGQLAAAVMEGSIAVEIIFNRQGICWWFAKSAIQLDVPAVMGMCLFMAMVYVTTNLIVDLLYAYIDPRIRLN